MAFYCFSMNYRLFHPDDFAQMYAVEEICFQPPVRFPRRYMRRLVDNPDSITWVAEEQGRIAGFSIIDFGSDYAISFVGIRRRSAGYGISGSRSINPYGPVPTSFSRLEWRFASLDSATG